MVFGVFPQLLISPHSAAAQVTKTQESSGIYPTWVQVLSDPGLSPSSRFCRLLSQFIFLHPSGLRNISFCSLKNKCGEMCNSAKDIAVLTHISKGSAQSCSRDLLGLFAVALLSLAS